MPYKDRTSERAKEASRRSVRKYGKTLRGVFFRRFHLMKNRCYREKNLDYAYYGARGIHIEWASSEEFYNDMWESFVKHTSEFGTRATTLDRIDPNKNYSKENCRWTTMHVQNRNRRDTKIISYGGEEMCLTDWAKKMNISRATLYRRIYEYKWKIDDALTIPVQK